jgi:radical SAM protein with 4Fe4S-binding SPASM domain
MIFKKEIRSLFKNINSLLLRKALHSKSSTCWNYPRRVEFVIINRCNADCIMCGDIFDGKKLDIQPFMRIAKQTLPYAKEAYFIGGELLLHPGFYEISEYANRFGVQLYMTTNLSVLTPDRAEALKKFFKAITISIDSPCKETYEMIRTGLSFEKLKKNLTRVSEIKRENGMRVTIALVAMRQNIEELPGMVDFTADYGFEGLGVTLAVIRPNKLEFKDSLLFHRPLANKYFELARERAFFRGIAISLPKLFDLEKAPYVDENSLTTSYKYCPRPWDRVRILIDGTVIPCCILYSENMGNILHTKFRKTWNSEKYKNLRKSFREGSDTMPLQCRQCRLIGENDSNNGMIHIPDNLDSINALKAILQSQFQG